MKKYLGWAAIAFVLFYLITQPGGAATVVHSAIHGLGVAANSLSSFVTHLTA
jgi:hypothetical protein